MKHDLKKLIAVIDSYHLVLYEAQGEKIIGGPQNADLSFHHHVDRERGHGFYDSAFGFSVSAPEPHTTPKEVDQQDAARRICKHLEGLFTDHSAYHELILAAEPRMLGHIRAHLRKHLEEKITKEVHKDLVNHSTALIEQAVFAEKA